MKTEIWKYTVICQDGEKWECVFDFEVSDQRVLAEFRKVIGLPKVLRIEHHKIIHYRQDRDPIKIEEEV